MQLEILPAIDAVPEAAWDELLDERATPFMRWAWLEALERSGCVSAEADWVPSHLALYRDGPRGRRLIAAAPAYIKHGSDGDFSRDWGWAEAAQRGGVPYYPKLVFGVPFTPVTGQRILVAADEPRGPAVAAIVRGAIERCRQQRVRSLHVLFPHEAEAKELSSPGLGLGLDLAHRVAFQYHWQNPGYRSTDEYLARFDAKHRHQQRRERRSPAEQGIHLRTIRGDELARDPERWADVAHDLHHATVQKLMWGRWWLNRAFYRRVFARLPGPLEVVVAERDGRIVAGAFNVATPSHLYGRYWGCTEEHRYLHFNVCLYHSIDECIARGARVFEGGAGGEHKIARGFEPVATHSLHAFFDPRLARPLAEYIAREAEERVAALARWQATAPVLKPPTESADPAAPGSQMVPSEPT